MYTKIGMTKLLIPRSTLTKVNQISTKSSTFSSHIVKLVPVVCLTWYQSYIEDVCFHSLACDRGKSVSLLKNNRSGIFFMKKTWTSRSCIYCRHLWSLVAHLWTIRSFGSHYSQGWPLLLGFGNFFRIFRHLEVGVLITFVIFSFLCIVLITTVQHLGSEVIQS